MGADKKEERFDSAGRGRASLDHRGGSNLALKALVRLTRLALLGAVARKRVTGTSTSKDANYR